ncbi:hypothetical protein [Rhodococcus erythropolis]|uniref:Uncharacterized protein n=1 Tax=Rhodococcus erythropolis TaxID=1833 RepID=A0A8I1D2N9_RHOER|nr:hypothetical protein [Rhodococcus erythropolis]MBH5141090.1 hypothetical protein [Rhodococcus erythropolis]
MPHDTPSENGAGWPTSYLVEPADAPAFRVRFRPALDGPLAQAYPAGIHDVEVRVESLVDADGVNRACQSMFVDHPQCRRITFAARANDVSVIAFAEEAGFRYVLDVDVREPAGSAPENTATELSLLVLEPQWILEQPIAVDDLPLS